MAAQITSEIMVGLTEKIREGIEVACLCCGMKPSQYARQAIYEKLCREGVLEPPTFRRLSNSAPSELQAAE
jgi:hypothetical protein